MAFAEKSAAVGIDFTHINGARGEKWMPETMGGGVAVLDYDGDGKPDLLFVSSAEWPGGPARSAPRPSLALYRNEGNDPGGLPRFRNATREAGLDRTAFYGMGASVGDYDNDGRDDVLVTALDHARLFHNVGGRFEEVTAKAGIGDPGWTTSAAWFDYDGDGLLDLYVCHYVDWTPKKDLFCTLDGKTKSYCTPERYPGTSSRLYRNLGKGRFEDVTKKAGVSTANQKALGVAPWDFDGDGRIDFFVANDTAPNNLFRNKGDGTFEDVGISTGVAVDEAGRSRGSMGVAWADTKNGKGAAVAIGNFSNELKSLYWTDSGEVFLDESPAQRRGAELAPGPDLRPLLLRRGPRRAHGPAARQRPRRADGPGGPERRRVPAGPDALPQRRRRTVHAIRRDAPETSARRWWPAAPRTPTSTATATWTSCIAQNGGSGPRVPRIRWTRRRRACACVSSDPAGRTATPSARASPPPIGSLRLTQQVAGGAVLPLLLREDPDVRPGRRREDRSLSRSAGRTARRKRCGTFRAERG